MIYSNCSLLITWLGSGDSTVQKCFALSCLYYLSTIVSRMYEANVDSSLSQCTTLRRDFKNEELLLDVATYDQYTIIYRKYSLDNIFQSFKQILQAALWITRVTQFLSTLFIQLFYILYIYWPFFINLLINNLNAIAWKISFFDGCKYLYLIFFINYGM